MSASMRLNRWGERIALNFPAVLRTSGEHTERVLIRDISLSGAYFQTALRLRLNAPVSVRLETGEDWWAGIVTRKDNSGLAVEWVDPGLLVMTAIQAGSRSDPATPAGRRLFPVGRNPEELG